MPSLRPILSLRSLVPLIAALLIVAVFALLPWQAAVTLLVLVTILCGGLFEQIARWWRTLPDGESSQAGTPEPQAAPREQELPPIPMG